MAQKAIGPTFAAELAAAGLAGEPFAWSADGTLTFSSAMTPAQIAAVDAVYAAHDPTKPAPMPPTVLDAATLAAALIATGAAPLTQAAINAAIAAGSGGPVAAAAAAIAPPKAA